MTEELLLKDRVFLIIEIDGKHYDFFGLLIDEFIGEPYGQKTLMDVIKNNRKENKIPHSSINSFPILSVNNTSICVSNRTG